jgi:Tfp pilus assembly PilM family ATPase
MQIDVEITEKELREMVREKFNEMCNIPVQDKDIDIVVKTTQNYRANWERGQFKARVHITK